MAPRAKNTARTKKPVASRVSPTKKEVEKMTEEIKKPRKMPQIPKKPIILIALVLLVIGLIYVTNKLMVVAWVDRQPISWFEYYNQVDKKYGNSVKEQLIAEKLIKDEAANRKVSVSNEAVNAEVSKVEKEQGGAEQLNQALEFNGLTRAEFINRTRLQLLVQKMFGGDVNISDEDVKKYIDENKEQFKSVPTDAEKATLKEQLKQQKVSQNFNNWLKEALKSSRVKRS